MTDLHKKEIEIQVKLDQDTDASFLSILADKNKEIDRLNNKISIQKNQLAYYLQKSTNWEQINRLAKTCESNVDQVNLPVNLAVYNFCKKARIQNRIELLYRYMKKASRKIENTLHIQETLLNGITENVCKLAKKRGYDALACEFGEFIVESKHLELLNNLLVATIALKRELGSYRNCCNRLITIEDERNTIVEQIYSLPAEERINANYLMRLEYEKHDLKNELRIISKKQQQLQQKFSGISNWYKNNIKELVLSTPALDNVQTNAIKLINLTKKHTHCNLKETTESKISIEQILTCIRLSFNQSETNIANTTFYGLIKNEIEKETECWKSSYIKELNQKANECNSLHRHLNEITQERNKLYNIIKKLQRQLNEIKVSNKEEISRISMERDSLKKQIDDLEMIRTAYTELVEKQTDMATIEKNYHKQIIEQDKIVAELQDENNILEVQTTYQKNFIQLQSDFINYLSKNNSAGSDTVQYFGKQFVDEYEFHISEENTCCKSITQVNLDDIKTDEDNNVTCYFNEKKSLTLTTLPEYVVNDVNSNEKNNTQIPVNSLINTSETNHHIIIQIDASGGSVQVLNNNTVCLKFVNTASATPSKPIIQIDDDCGTDDDNMLMNKDGELNEIPPICCNSLSKEIHIDDEEIY